MRPSKRGKLSKSDFSQSVPPYNSSQFRNLLQGAIRLAGVPPQRSGLQVHDQNALHEPGRQTFGRRTLECILPPRDAAWPIHTVDLGDPGAQVFKGAVLH